MQNIFAPQIKLNMDLVQHIFGIYQECEKRGINYTQIDQYIQGGSRIGIEEKDYISFGNCSYIGLDQDNRIREAAIKAIEKYGNVYSSSRAFSSLRFLSDTEEKLKELFNRPVLMTTTTGLTNSGSIPKLCSKKDLILYDIQVHRTVQDAILICKGNGATTKMLPHNATDEIENFLQESGSNYEKIWWMCDSLFSMYGDEAPLEYYYSLLEKYDKFFLYVDDAHGMSWAGEKGSGFMRSKIPWHDKLFMATSLAKGFGAHGGALVIPNELIKQQLKYTSTSIVFSGPLTPPSIGAVSASADIHLSEEIISLQKLLMSNISYFRELCTQYSINLISKNLSPIQFIEIGKTNDTIHIASLLFQAGFLVNPCDFPAVPRNKSGLRLTLTTLHTKDEMKLFIQSLKNILD